MNINDQIISNILLKGSYNQPLKASDLYRMVGADRNQMELDTFQRIVTKAVEVYYEEQYNNMLNGKPFKLICSSSAGYYVAKTKEEATEGLLFYSSRMLPMLEKRRRLKKMIAGLAPVQQGRLF